MFAPAWEETPWGAAAGCTGGGLQGTLKPGAPSPPGAAGGGAASAVSGAVACESPAGRALMPLVLGGGASLPLVAGGGETKRLVQAAGSGGVAAVGGTPPPPLPPPSDAAVPPSGTPAPSGKPPRAPLLDGGSVPAEAPPGAFGRPGGGVPAAAPAAAAGAADPCWSHFRGLGNCGFHQMKNPWEPVWKNGDWRCPRCGDHQFARKQICGRCGAPKAPSWHEALPWGPWHEGTDGGRGFPPPGNHWLGHGEEAQPRGGYRGAAAAPPSGAGTESAASAWGPGSSAVAPPPVQPGGPPASAVAAPKTGGVGDGRGAGPSPPSRQACGTAGARGCTPPPRGRRLLNQEASAGRCGAAISDSAAGSDSDDAASVSWNTWVGGRSHGQPKSGWVHDSAEACGSSPPGCPGARTDSSWFGGSWGGNSWDYARGEPSSAEAWGSPPPRSGAAARRRAESATQGGCRPTPLFGTGPASGGGGAQAGQAGGWKAVWLRRTDEAGEYWVLEERWVEALGGGGGGACAGVRPPAGAAAGSRDLRLAGAPWRARGDSVGGSHYPAEVRGGSGWGSAQAWGPDYHDVSRDGGAGNRGW